MPDWDNTDSRERDEDATWRDLIARFDAPAATGQPAPWPAREDVPAAPPPPPVGPQVRPGTDGAAGTQGGPGAEKVAGRDNGVDQADAEPGGPGAGGEPARGVRGFDDEGVRRALSPDAVTGAREPDVIQAARHRRRPAGRSVRPGQAPAEPAADDEHFIPPDPPLPKLDSITKGAWAALFGGPGYLVVATAVGWSVSGIAAFCAVAAFITGFALLVLRMNEPGPGGPDDGDDGAVV